MTAQIEPEIIDWLLAGDPAVRWQTLQDLTAAAPEVVAAERQKVAVEGWGAALLAEQDPSGTWAGKLYSPKWISTTYTLLLLRRLGLPADNPQAHRGCRLLLEKGLYHDGGINYFKSMKDSETCVTGMVLSILAFFDYPDDRVGRLVEHLLGQQMADGGWNCESYNGATHSSFHTTMSVLEGLWAYEVRHPEVESATRAARQKAHEFLLQHHLYRSHRTGEIVDVRMTRLSFPPRWRFDILRALDYWQACRAPYDERLADALAVLEKKRRKDGRFPLQQRHPGRTFFELEKAGQPSRINTVRALRVLNWFGRD